MPMVPCVVVTATSLPKIWKLCWCIYHDDVPAQIRVDQEYFYFPLQYGDPSEFEKQLAPLTEEELNDLAAGEHHDMERLVAKYELTQLHAALNDFFEGGDDYLARPLQPIAEAMVAGLKDD